jgi:hypothetical protein
MNYERAKQMNDELVANIVSFEEDDAVAVLAFCAEEGQSSQYLMLQFLCKRTSKTDVFGWAVCTSNEMIRRSGATTG